jgi:hypothetical protein
VNDNTPSYGNRKGYRHFCIYIYNPDNELQIKRIKPIYDVELDRDYFHYSTGTVNLHEDKFPYFYINTRFINDYSLVDNPSSFFYDPDDPGITWEDKFVVELISGFYSERWGSDDNIVNGFYVYFLNG